MIGHEEICPETKRRTTCRGSKEGRPPSRRSQGLGSPQELEHDLLPGGRWPAYDQATLIRGRPPTEAHVLRLLVGEGFLGAGAAVHHVHGIQEDRAGDGYRGGPGRGVGYDREAVGSWVRCHLRFSCFNRFLVLHCCSSDGSSGHFLG